MTWLVLLFLVGVLVVLPIVIYNRLVRARNEYRNAFAQIQVQLKRRHDLIPNLVESTRAYLEHESQTLEAVIQARNHAAGLLESAASSSVGDNAADIISLAAGEHQLSVALRNLSVTVEAYPELKANHSVQALTEELAGAENRVAFARQAYNDAVLAYNNARETFPASLLADFFGHKQNAAMLQFDDHAVIRHAPQVDFRR
ncbi:LemA family protein [Neisseria sp. Dent CA1/247]|uniref:LemA family protein n=1 Tax=Neisseria sp. Dent CA1/247 TaxID=2912675 RepID=UPI001FD476C8|nr:LemA family protein [Neisseria sp. Dent CA1/247]UOO77608.1 LemA family protein [Neisseria sp. Dent CA1/247]